jgi:hypothetical protein
MMKTMTLMNLSAIALAMTLALPSSAAAAGNRPFRGEAVLAAAVAAPVEKVVEGVTWRCEADKCLGAADHWSTLDSHMKECRKVASVLGELASYRSRGRSLSAKQVGHCNRAIS